LTDCCLDVVDVFNEALCVIASDPALESLPPNKLPPGSIIAGSAWRFGSRFPVAGLAECFAEDGHGW